MLSSRPKRLPPLAALRAFDAVARHRSIRTAAAELGVSAAAVSQHVKALEADLGVALLYRRHRGVALTASGRRLAPGLMAGFASLVSAVALIREDGFEGKLTVSAAPSLATKWLVPRLDRFQAAHPEIEVRVIANGEICDFARDGVDIALRHGRGRYAGCLSHELLPAILTPVCAPWMAKDLAARGSPADLLGYLLLHDANCEADPALPGWVDWFAAAGLQNATAGKGPRFSDTHLAVEAAIAGQGIALAAEGLVAADVKGGRLAHPFTSSVRGTTAYWMVAPAPASGQPKVRAFRNWLLSQARETRLSQTQP